jgi:hypothetical protein
MQCVCHAVHCHSFSEPLELETCVMWSTDCIDRAILLHLAG